MSQTPQNVLDYQPRPTRFTNVGDFWAYVAPMAVFMVLTWLGTQSPSLYAITYVAKTLIVPVVLWAFWTHYTKIRWDYWWLGIIVGVIGVVQWVGMEKLLMSQPWLSWTRMISDVEAAAYKPAEHFASPGIMWGFIILRWAGASLVVPVMEELFWRDFLWRSMGSPNDFKLLKVGEYDRAGFWLVPLFFAMVHVQWLTAIVWGLMIATLLLKTRSLGACIIAHGVTNFLLGVYVLYTGEWFFW